MNPLKANSDAIKSFCEKHKLEKLYAFGSVLTSAFNEERDVDFSIEFKNQDIEKYVSNFFILKEELEIRFKREIDLIEYKAISNPYFKEEVDETKVLVFNTSKLIF